jgi:hypothetical protein
MQEKAAMRSDFAEHTGGFECTNLGTLSAAA